MTTETVAKKIDELRVADLKVALEERSLDTHGNKTDLVKRLKQDLIDKGIDPDTHEFQLPKPAASLPKRQRANSATVKPDVDASNGQKGEDDGDEATETADTMAAESDAAEQPEDDDEADVDEVEDELAEGDEVVDEVGEVDESIEVPDFENAEEPSSVSLETSNAMDNEDSLNLTIGEDEEKIFQDEETDGKHDDRSEDNTTNSATDAESSTDTKSATNGAPGAAVVTSTSGTGSNATAASDSSSSADKTNGTSAAGNDSSIDNKTGAKSDDSEAKSSSSNKTSSAKEDKETASSSTKNSTATGASSSSNSKSKATSSSSSSSSSSASRNLWVSGLSSLTRATDLKMIFSKHGKVVGAKVVTNTRTPYTRCYGYVTMGSSADATKCIEQLNRIELHGRIVTVERAKSDIACVKTAGDSSSSPTAAAAKVDGDDTQGKDKSTSAAEKTASSKEGGGGSAEPNDGDDKKKRSADSSRSATEQRGAGGPRDNGRPKRGVSRDRDYGTAGSSNSQRRAPPGKGRPVTDREREVLSFQKIREERERQRLRERERKVREEERRRQDARRRQREEEERLARERERLKKERVRLEREKADLLRLERERQKLEREKIELERLELKRQQMKIEEAKRAIKRPSDHDRFPEVDRKRPAPDRRFEPPPPPRFDTSISRAAPYVEKKRVDDYVAPAKGRDDYAAKRDNFKRPVNDYPKRDDIVSRSNAYDSRNSAPANKDRYGVAPSDSRPNSSFPSGRGGRDDRSDVRNVNAPKSRYVDSGSSGDNRYSERSSGSSSWPNSGGPSSSTSATKSFGGGSGGNHIPSVGGGGDMWNQKPTDSNWRAMDQNQDRYDRTYNERKSQAAPGQYISAPPSRQNSYVARPQDRGYNSNNTNMSSRFDNNRF